MRWITLFALILLTASFVCAAEPELSTEVEGLRGRIIAVPQGKHTKLVLELHNVKSLPRWIVTHDPFAFDLTVRDRHGEEIVPDAERADIISSPQPAIISRDSYTGIPVTISPGPDNAWNLDITTKLWKLQPGKYTLTGVYGITQRRPRDDNYPMKVGKAFEWGGEIVCPEIEITVK